LVRRNLYFPGAVPEGGRGGETPMYAHPLICKKSLKFTVKFWNVEPPKLNRDVSLWKYWDGWWWKTNFIWLFFPLNPMRPFFRLFYRLWLPVTVFIIYEVLCRSSVHCLTYSI
jgi:hypothetical protein